MHAVRRRLRACAWLALLAIATLAVGPTVSRMLVPEGGAAFMSGASPHQHDEPVAVSTTASMQKMGSAHHHPGLALEPAAMQPGAMQAGAMPAAPHGPAHQHALEHCGLCVLAAHAFAFVQERPAVSAWVECTRPAHDRLAPAVPRLRCDWSPANSRGPPLRA